MVDDEATEAMSNGADNAEVEAQPSNSPRREMVADHGRISRRALPICPAEL